MSTILNAIRAAVLPGATADALAAEAETGAAALDLTLAPAAAHSEGDTMSGIQTMPGAAAAVTGGNSDGYKAAMGRINAVVTADGIAGDAGRMSAALSLASAAPDMTAEAVVAFVTANVPAASGAPAPVAAPAAAAPASQPGATSYEQQRVAAAALAMPGGASASAKAGPKLDREAIFAARRNATKGE